MKNSYLPWSRVLRSAAAVGLALVLAACGGGQTNNSSTTSDTASTGWVGTKTVGTAGAYTTGSSVAIDADGNVYVAGQTDAGFDRNAEGNDTFVTKYNSSGVRQYTRQMGNTVVEMSARSVSIDASGNVYVAGATSVGLDGNSQAGYQDFFLIKYNSIGVKQFTRQLGLTDAITEARAVATDTSGNVYVVGDTEADLETMTRTGRDGAFLIKYNSDGVKQYARRLDGQNFGTYGRSVATDANGNVYVAGYTGGSLDDQTSSGGLDFFVTKYDSSGVKQYTRQLGFAGTVDVQAETYAESVATDTSGNVYVAGSTSGALDGQTRVGTRDSFVTKYNSFGVKQYTRQFGVAGEATFGYAVATDTSGNLFVTGGTEGALDGNLLTGERDTFVTKFNSAGVKQFTTLLGVAGQGITGRAVGTDARGNAYVVGRTSGALDGNVLIGNSDAFVTKYNSSGVKQ
jgi:hypothetical protein